MNVTTQTPNLVKLHLEGNIIPQRLGGITHYNLHPMIKDISSCCLPCCRGSWDPRRLSWPPLCPGHATPHWPGLLPSGSLANTWTRWRKIEVLLFKHAQSFGLPSTRTFELHCHLLDTRGYNILLKEGGLLPCTFNWGRFIVMQLGLFLYWCWQQRLEVSSDECGAAVEDSG